MFVEEVAGIALQSRITTSPLYQVIQKELLANSLPGRPAKQVPRVFISRRTHSGRQGLPILQSVCMVDRALIMWHDACQRPSWPQAKRHSRDCQHDVRQVDQVKNDMTKMWPSAWYTLRNFASWSRHRGSAQAGRFWKVLQTFQETFSRQLQPQTAMGVSEKSYGTTLTSMQRRVLSSLHFDEQTSLSAALSVPKELRDHLGGWSAQGSDHYARVAGRMITNSQKLVISARQDLSDDLSQRQKQPRSSTITCAPKSTLQNTERSEVSHQSHRHQGQQTLRKTNGWRARTQRQKHWVRTPTQRVNEHAHSSRRSTTYPPRAETVMVPGIDYPRYVHVGAQMPKLGDLASANCAPATELRSQTATQTLRRRRIPVKTEVSRRRVKGLVTTTRKHSARGHYAESKDTVLLHTVWPRWLPRLVVGSVAFSRLFCPCGFCVGWFSVLFWRFRVFRVLTRSAPGVNSRNWGAKVPASDGLICFSSFFLDGASRRPSLAVPSR